MIITIDTDRSLIVQDEAGTPRHVSLYSKESFELLSRLWLKVGWNQKYPYTFSWMGRPIIQLPEDIVRMQEVIYSVQPDVIVETGVAHGGSLIFYASLFKAIGSGRVIGIDIEIRPQNRRAIEEHALAPLITLIEGNSVDSAVVERAKEAVGRADSVMVVLDSNHTRAHVRAELEAYHELVSPGSYIVATDGSMKDLWDVPRGKKEWVSDNPERAAVDFLEHHPEFEIHRPEWPFNESELSEPITHWPSAWLRRRPTSKPRP